ncbi:Nucleotide exchange factor SIL1 [Spathaspora sp. JA1]|nr:Nucleotide exchange factor SIL1 [Spathaspora sp. JA1]
MKLSLLLSLAFYLTSINSAIIAPKKDLICQNPEDPLDCYPKIFQPSKEWQLIKQGQDIPPGLHVRLNIDTLKREAKLMDPNEDVESEQQEGIVVVEQEVEHSSTVAHNEQLIQEAIQKHKANSRSKVNIHDLNNFDSAIAEAGQYQVGGDLEKFWLALNTLEDLSHDIEFGVKITRDGPTIENLINVASSFQNLEITDQIYRIIGGSLRNNPEAINNLLENIDVVYIHDLFRQLHDSKDIIQKRVLGIIQALTQNTSFANQYFSFDHSLGLDDIVDIFPSLGPESRVRASNILQDLKLYTPPESKREVIGPEQQFSSFIQKSLIEEKVNSNQMKQYFLKLVEIHTEAPSLKPSQDFINWLAQEVELRKDNKKRDDYSQKDKDFDRDMLIARHEVFGNPMGLRKAIADEL